MSSPRSDVPTGVTSESHFYERRSQDTAIDFKDRRMIERRIQMSSTASERRRLVSQVRRQQREILTIPVLFEVNESEFSGYSQNISPLGILIISQRPISAGTPMALHFSFGEGTCYLNISGQVVFCGETQNERGLTAIGIKFPVIRDFEQIILTCLIKDLKATSSLTEKSLLKIVISTDRLATELSEISVGRPCQKPVHLPRKQARHASKIIGWGSYLPSDEYMSTDITRMVHSDGYKNVGEVIETLTGLKSRRYASPGLFPSDLAAIASRKALDNAGVDPKDLDVIIFFGISRDFDEPATANVLQEKLGAVNSYAFDIANACNGFVTAVDLLDSLIESGRCEMGLVATGELISPYIDWTPRSREDFKNTIFSYTIGDAGGAAVLTRAKARDEKGILGRYFINNGSYWRIAIAGTVPGANANDKFFKSRGIDMELASIECMPPGFTEILDSLDWSINDVDLVIPHQIPISIQQNLYEKTLKLPKDKLFWTFPKFGNNATASMPVAMCEAIKAGRVKDGDKVLLLGGAAGFSVGIIGFVY